MSGFDERTAKRKLIDSNSERGEHAVTFNSAGVAGKWRKVSPGESRLAIQAFSRGKRRNGRSRNAVWDKERQKRELMMQYRSKAITLTEWREKMEELDIAESDTDDEIIIIGERRGHSQLFLHEQLPESRPVVIQTPTTPLEYVRSFYGSLAAGAVAEHPSPEQEHQYRGTENNPTCHPSSLASGQPGDPEALGTAATNAKKATSDRVSAGSGGVARGAGPAGSSLTGYSPQSSQKGKQREINTLSVDLELVEEELVRVKRLVSLLEKERRALMRRMK